MDTVWCVGGGIDINEYYKQITQHKQDDKLSLFVSTQGWPRNTSKPNNPFLPLNKNVLCVFYVTRNENMNQMYLESVRYHYRKFISENKNSENWIPPLIAIDTPYNNGRDSSYAICDHEHNFEEFKSILYTHRIVQNGCDNTFEYRIKDIIFRYILCFKLKKMNYITSINIVKTSEIIKTNKVIETNTVTEINKIKQEIKKYRVIDSTIIPILEHPYSDSTVIGHAQYGDIFVCDASFDNDMYWTKIIYKNTTGYIKTKINDTIILLELGETSVCTDCNNKYNEIQCGICKAQI